MLDPRPIPFPALPVEDRREILDLLRWMAVHLEAADALERRADRSPNPTLALVLRERAAERRAIAERVRADLAVHDVVPFRRHCRPV
jgi:hypothetical protein